MRMKKANFNLLGRFALIIYLNQEIPFIIDGKPIKKKEILCNVDGERWNIELTESDTQIGVIDLDDDGEEPVYLLEKIHILSIVHNENVIWDNENKKLTIQNHGVILQKGK